VADVAARLQIPDEGWVRRNAGLLGGFKLGRARNAPWRFRPGRLDEAIARMERQPIADPEPRGRRGSSRLAADPDTPADRLTPRPRL
jgi:hypothetical protein